MRCFQVLFRALIAPAIFGFIVASVLPATAAVYSPRQALPADTIQQFLANPAALLSQYPNGGPQMIARIRDLVASDPATVDVVLGLLKNANDAQATATGTAYGQVALMAVGTDAPFATDLQTKIAQAGNVAAITAFSAVVGGDIKLAAATGPGGGIGGGGESQTSSSSGLGGFFAGSSFSLNQGIHNTPDEFSIPSPGGGGPGSNSVSAH